MLDNTEGAMKKDNPEKLETWGTQDTGQINVRQCRRGNQKWGTQDTGQINVRGIPKGQSKMDNQEKLAT